MAGGLIGAVLGPNLAQRTPSLTTVPYERGNDVRVHGGMPRSGILGFQDGTPYSQMSPL
jgi:hypothetical protein